jgi:predicted metal-dependent phosphotriesterase family hydrolase
MQTVHGPIDSAPLGTTSKQQGVTDDQLNEMLIHNPRRIFERQGAY